MGEDYDNRTYGRTVSRYYDGWYSKADPAMLDVLESLYGDGPALELGIGSGRVAIPLAKEGLDIHGVDASPEMVELMRRKPGGASIPVTMGDLSQPVEGGPFSLVFVVFNTFFGLTTQEEQKRCFRSVAGMLAPGGRFVLECFFPDVARFEDGQTARTIEAGGELVRLECTRHNGAEQTIATTQVLLGGESGVELLPLRIRYAWPSELDLMAELAGFSLQSRWGGWSGQPFRDGCNRHVSVYVLPEGRSGVRS
jgi:SAM-dependent methyltransferase